MDVQVTGYEINHELKSYKQFGGVYTRDTLPKVLDRPSGIIVNLDTIKGKGTHWVSLLQNRISLNTSSHTPKRIYYLIVIRYKTLTAPRVASFVSITLNVV